MEDTSVQKFLDKNIDKVLNQLPDKFDSHDFIQQLIKADESGYVECLCLYLEKHSNGIFRTLHSMIGRYLSRSKKIRSIGSILSDNIKDYISINEGWVKL